MPTPLSAAELRAAVRPADPACACAVLVCPGWESVVAPLDAAGYERIGTLRPEHDDEPTVEEYHVDGSRFWSTNAPIALAFFPYNRCEVWRCRACGRGFLQYTEFGGYYVDHRLREIDAARIV